MMLQAFSLIDLSSDDTMLVSEYYEAVARLNELVEVECDQVHLHFTCTFNGREDEQTLTTCSSCRERVVEMSRLFVELWPGDWYSGHGAYIQDSLLDTIESEKASTDGMDIASMIKFRLKYSDLADSIIKDLSLPVPSNKPCGVWSKAEWEKERRKRDDESVFDRSWDLTWRKLIDGNLMPQGTVKQGPEFIRFVQYLVAAVRQREFTTKMSHDEYDELIEKIIQLVKDARASNPELACHSAAVQQARVERKGLWRNTCLLKLRKNCKMECRACGFVKPKAQAGESNTCFQGLWMKNCQPS
ncbi:hypothetical protein CPAR01_13265 [Colletotrichum paranaense]|uniref:Uncharacterized protein n=1 Tax=Colletotrichum paranaense TaxID=1914294 RepID=A0ABQ9S5G4_9PEZI|nr:uncharacterized protein CPAR01_13265 [Colletotrichum paranaense]KAK1526737.1 hypothetical protein CPAR01_13265 [Colletotrichum paranaense]